MGEETTQQGSGNSAQQPANSSNQQATSSAPPNPNLPTATLRVQVKNNSHLKGVGDNPTKGK